MFSANAVAVLAGDDAEAVVFDLVQPCVAGGWSRLSWYAYQVARIWQKWLSRRDRGSRLHWRRLGRQAWRDEPVCPGGYRTLRSNVLVSVRIAAT